MTSPVRVEKRTSAAKAVQRAATYGTAEPVPFVFDGLFPSLSGAVQSGHPKNLIWTRLSLGDYPEVRSSHLLERKTLPQGLKATTMTTFCAGDKSPAYPKREFFRSLLEAGVEAKPPTASRRDRISGEKAAKVHDIETVVQIVSVELQARVQLVAFVDVQT